jgi:hypothetical protein
MTIGHPLHGLLGAENGPDRVDGEYPLHTLERKILQPGLLREDRCVVYEHIDPAELPVDCRKELCHLIWIRTIRAYSQRPASRTSHISGYGMSSSLIGNKADCDIVALCGSKPRSRRADPTASTGYENERRLRDDIHLAYLFQ